MFLSEVVARRNVNVALGRPAWQQSTFTSQPASLAVDGDYGTRASTTMYMSNPWWVVDLGGPSYVRGIKLTNMPLPELGMH